jgi:AAA domain
MNKHDVNDTLCDAGDEGVRARNDRAKNFNGNGGGTRFTLKRFEDIKPSTVPNYLIKGLLPRQGLAVIWGPPKSGKSFVSFDLAMCIALGRDYRGRRVRQGGVIYLAVEGGAGFARRVEAWRRRHLDRHYAAVPFHLLDVPLDLVAEHAALITAIHEQVADPPAAVFVDTLNRALGGGDENSAADMGKLIHAADALHTAFGCLVVLVHHCGINNTRPRGHTSLAGANDVQISVSKDSAGVITVSVEHMKDGAPGQPFACRLETVEIGLDDEGGAGTSCVVVPADAAAASASKGAGKTVTSNQARFLDILVDATIDAPEPHRTTISIPGGRTAISREWLKMCCISKGWLEEDRNAKSRAKLSEMINTLAGKRLIGCLNLYIWDAR